nr:MAG TPA: hypothetical protein [Caudoviricetes sp.]
MTKKVVLKNNHFIPSPFPVVTAYENKFVKVWNKNDKKGSSEK